MMGLAMLWEHPRLAESLVQSFRSSQQIPDRSLSDGLLQQINRTAYERDFSVNSDGEIPQKAQTTFNNAATTLGGLRNYSLSGGLTAEKFANTAPRLLEGKTFSWDVSCGLTSGWEVEYKKRSLDNLKFGNGATAWGLVWEGGTYSFMPSDTDWKSWNSWVYDDHQQCCDDSASACLFYDTRNHVRARYRAKITPDPLDSAYYDATKGTRIGEIYSQESLSEGIISHQLVIEADVETTAGDLGWLGLGDESFTAEAIASFGVIVRNLTTGESDEVQFDILSGTSTGSYNYAFPKAGLYSIFIYLKSIAVNGILVSTPLKDEIQERGGNWIKASHPMRTLVYVSPSPNWTNNYIPVVDAEPLKDETVKDESVLINDQSSDSDDSDDETVMWPWVMAGGLAVVAFTLAR